MSMYCYPITELYQDVMLSVHIMAGHFLFNYLHFIFQDVDFKILTMDRELLSAYYNISITSNSSFCLCP